MNKNRPVHEIRFGSIKGSIWENTNPDKSTRHNVTFSRSYRDKETDEWKNTEIFGRDDLLLVAKVADVAHSWICQQRPVGNGNRDPG